MTRGGRRNGRTRRRGNPRQSPIAGAVVSRRTKTGTTPPPGDGKGPHRIAGMSTIATQLEGLIDRRLPERMRATGGLAPKMSLITVAHRRGDEIAMVMADLVAGEKSTMITVGDGREVTTLAVEEGTIMAVGGGTIMDMEGGTTMDVVGGTTITGGGREVIIMVVVVVVGGRGMKTTAEEEGRGMTTMVVEEGEGMIIAVGEGGKEMTTEVVVAGGGRGMMTILRVRGEGTTTIVEVEGITTTAGGEGRGREKGAGGDRKPIERGSGGVRGTEMGRGTLEGHLLPEVEGRTIRAIEGMPREIAGVGMIMEPEEAGGRETRRHLGVPVGGGGSHPLVPRVMTRKWMRKVLNW